MVVRNSMSTLIALAGAIVVALACTVGSEHERLRQARASSPRHSTAANLFSHPVNLFFGVFSRQSSTYPKSLLSDDQLDAYNRDGFIVISGLLDDTEVEDLLNAGESLISKHVKKSVGKMSSNGNFQVHEFGLLLNDKRFRDVALYSKLPLAAAELLQMDSKRQNLRVLKDVFLAKGRESTSSCGWHVDDQMFWPAAYQMPRSKDVDQSGINAWIALDNMPIEVGGSMAVSPSSHTQDFSWTSDALSALNFREEFSNGIPKEDLFEMIKNGKVDSCGLKKFAPHVHNDIELSKKEFNFKRGDVIFMNRWLFHRSTDVTEKGKLALQTMGHSVDSKQATGASLLKRYSVRYATGDALLPKGFMTEMSVLASDGLNLGRSLDNVTGDWYPKCWPNVDLDVDDKIEHLVRHEVPSAQEKHMLIMTEAMKLFQSD